MPSLLERSSVYESWWDFDPGATAAKKQDQVGVEKGGRPGARHVLLPEASRGSGDFWSLILCNF